MTTPKSQPTIALVYDRAAAQGGAERVLVALRQAFPDATLYTSLWNESEAPWSKGWAVRSSWLQFLPTWARRYRWWGWLMPFIFEGMDVSQADIVISVTGESAKAIITKPNQLHICYLLTPTRYLWSHSAEAVVSLWPIFRPLARRVIRLLQKWDRLTATRPDVIIPISKLVRQRSEKYYQRSTEEPIYPPLTNLAPAETPGFIPTGDFLLTWGRHVAYKRFDLAIEAAVQRKASLVVAGDGPMTKRLQRLAKKLDPVGKYVTFVGRIPDGELRWYLEHAQGAVFPQIEDFGISAGEAAMAGCPVVVHSQSGVAETLTAQQAIFIEKESREAVVAGIKQLQAKQWSRLDIKKQARHYAGEHFVRVWTQAVSRHWDKHSRSLINGTKGNHD